MVNGLQHKRNDFQLADIIFSVVCIVGKALSFKCSVPQ